MIVISDLRIAILGLGYVGLPLGLALSRHFRVFGYDSNPIRLRELRQNVDSTSETSSYTLEHSKITFLEDIKDAQDCNVFIVTVPTPIDSNNIPDLSALCAACRDIGSVLSSGDIVVFESTVYPGVTENICGPELESSSGLQCGSGFFLGYSPERINPGDRSHTVETVCKVVAGQTKGVTELLERIYGTALSAGVHVAPNIRTAEAAKVIENAQRDVNIAFINEVAMIFKNMDIDTGDVLAAARTKWNFLDFEPGLVGGHCIGVDPYYLAFGAQQAGHEPDVILAGRRINDAVASFVVDQIANMLRPSSRILVLGLTFKENVSDLRNSKVAELVTLLTQKGFQVSIHDPRAARLQAKAFYGIDLAEDLDESYSFDAVIGAVGHKEYRALDSSKLLRMVKNDGVIADLKGIWRAYEFPPPIRYWRL